jgi:hypothetical protein
VRYSLRVAPARARRAGDIPGRMPLAMPWSAIGRVTHLTGNPAHLFPDSQLWGADFGTVQ